MSNLSIFTRFVAMFSDGIKQEQPKNTFSDAIGWTAIKSSEKSGFISSETGNKKWIGMPSGYKLRGELYMAQYDQWVLLGLVKGKGEVGIADEKTKKYTTIITDDGLDRPLGLQSCVWTTLKVNIHANCSRVKIYFQTNEVYRVIELFDPCCDFSNTLLMKATCIGVLNVSAVRGIGTLVNGAYRAVMRIYDKDSNDTNFGTTSQPVSVADGDYRIDEETKYGLVIEGFNLPRDYNFAELVIVENINGADKYKVINDIGFADGYFSYVFTGAEGYYVDGKSADINNRKQQYFNGQDLEEEDGALFLTNTRAQRNYNLQKIVNTFRVGYKRWMVPIKYAKDYKGLRENENYDFCIWYNGMDGTRTISYNLINHMPEPEGTIPPNGYGNCQSCDVPAWAGQDTSRQTKLYWDQSACAISQSFRENFSNNFSANTNSEVNPLAKIKTDDNITSFVCNGSCAEGGCTGEGGCSGGSCEGASCFNASNGSDGLLPRSKGYDDDLFNNEEDPIINNDTQELCAILNCDRVTLQAIATSFIQGLYEIANAIRLGFSLDPIENPYQHPNCVCSSLAELQTWKMSFITDMKAVDDLYKTSYKSTKHIPSEFPCTTPGEKAYVGQICYECVDGYWNYINNEIHYKYKTTPFTRIRTQTDPLLERSQVAEKLDYKYAGSSRGSFAPSGTSGDKNPFGNNCIVDNGQPVAYSEGWFGYWETNERYPETIGRDDCLPIYGEHAGKNVRLYKVPSLGKEPHFLSMQEGVPSKQDRANDENDNGFVIFTGLRIEDITIPAVLSDWVCKKNPFTIGYSKRDESNKTVISTGILHGTFEGQIQGQPYLFPKHAVNSWEFYDANVNPGGFNTFRRGSSTSIPAYIYHSPDYHLYGNYNDGHYALYQMELNGKGYRHGLYADGKKPDSWSLPRKNEAGVRQGINLNHYICKPQPVFRCIKGMVEAPANSIVGKDSGLNFTRTLVNLHREGSQYIEFLTGDGVLPCVCPPCEGGVILSEKAVLSETGSWVVTYSFNVSGVATYRYCTIGLGGSTNCYDAVDNDTSIGISFNTTAANEVDDFGVRTLYVEKVSLKYNGCTYVSDAIGGYWETQVFTPAEPQETNRIIPISPIEEISDCECEDEIIGGKVGFTKGPDGPWGSLNNGAGDNNESDNSFIGDTINHETFIKNARAHLVTIMRYVPNQYGPIISRVFIPLGLSGSYNSGTDSSGKIKIEGLVGDSFIGPFNYKRSGFVSDKTIEDITPAIQFGRLFGGDGNSDPVFSVIFDVLVDLAKSILRVIGFEEIGTTPDSGIVSDLRNSQGGLRNGWLGMTDENTPIGPPSTGIYPDTFTPHIIKTYIHTFLTSDANLNYRGTGSILFGDDGVAEVYRGKLKTMEIDSTMPEGFELARAWLNRIKFYSIEPPKWKLIFRMILNFIWVYYIGFYIILEGIGLVSFDTSGFTGAIGAALSIVAAILVIAMGVSWINFWANVDDDNKVFDSMLGIDWAYPDKIFRNQDQAGQGSRFGMFHDRLRQFEDNYWYYNLSYSTVNQSDINFGMPFYYDTEFCPGKFTNRIIASNMQNTTSEIDAWRQFRPNHYVDIPRNRGKIMKLFSVGNGFYAQTTDSIFMINYRGDVQEQQTNDTLLLGRFYLFGKSRDVYGSAVEGWGGTKDPNASRSTHLGYFYFDRDARRFKVFTGSNADIPLTGIEEFMDNNIKFFLLDKFPDYPFVDQKCASGVHFDTGIDFANHLIYMYKKDYLPMDGVDYKNGEFTFEGKKIKFGDPKYFMDKSFMYEYSIKRQQWISRQYFRPDVFLMNRYNMFTVSDNIIYNHDTKTIYNNFYGKDYPSYIEIPLISQETHNSFLLKNIKIVGELIEVYDDGTERELDEPLFEKYMIYNGRQSSGWLSLRDISMRDDNNMIEDMTERNEKKWIRKGNGSIIEEFKNNLPVGQQPISVYNKELDIMDINGNPKSGEGDFEDDYLVLRLLSTKKHNQKIHLRKIIVTLKPEQDG